MFVIKSDFSYGFDPNSVYQLLGIDWLSIHNMAFNDLGEDVLVINNKGDGKYECNGLIYFAEYYTKAELLAEIILDNKDVIMGKIYNFYRKRAVFSENERLVDNANYVCDMMRYINMNSDDNLNPWIKS